MSDRRNLVRWWRPAVLLGVSGGLVAGACPTKDTVSPTTITAVVISPAGITIHPGQQATFHAWGKNGAGDSVQANIVFTATGGTINASGLYMAGGSTGTFRVIAALPAGTHADTAAVAITLVPVASVTVTPADPTLPAGTTLALTATMKDSSANVLTGRVVTWASGSTGVGTVDGNGVVTGVSAGTTVITATSEGVHGKDTVTVTAATATLVRITLSPDSTSVLTGHTVQFSVLGTFSDSSTATVPATYTATGGTISTSGLYTAGGTPGTFRVIATGAGGVKDTSAVVVTAPTLVRVLLTPDSVQLDTGATQQFSANGKFSDSSTSAISVTYSATGGGISAGGLYTAGTTAGTFRVIAVATGGLADTSKVVIVAPTLVRVILTPDSAQVDTGHTQQFTSTGKFSDSSTAPVAVTYSATGGSISAGGLYTAGTTAGTFRVIAVKTGGTLADTSKVVVVANASSAAECASPQAGWIFCDDFEQDRTSKYFETDSVGTAFTRVAGVGKDGSYGMKGHFTTGAQVAGDLHLAFGKTPSSYMKSGTGDSTTKYREIYWRMYVRTQNGWVGGAHDKLSRALILATSGFAEGMAAHVWAGDPPDTNYIILDPASGIDAAGNLVSTGYNQGLTYLGQGHTSTPIFDAAHVGAWYCVEAHVKLNDSGVKNGVFELWINSNLEAQETTLNWVSSYSAYGINAIYFENYWNAGAPVAEDRFFDNIVVSTQRIGC